MKKGMSIIRNITLLGQLSITLIVPLLLCVALCWWLNTRIGLGSWVYIPGFFFGLGGSAMSAYKFSVSFLKTDSDKNKKDEKKKVSFNNHL